MMTRTRTRTPLSLLAMLCALLSPAAVSAQATCAMNLSALEVESNDYAARVDAGGQALERMFKQFDKIDRAAARDATTCPAGLAQSRANLTETWRPVAPESEALLDCAIFFNRRILRSFEDAAKDNDANLIVSLRPVQARIIAVDETISDAAAQATFLDLRARALLREHDTVAARCSRLESIYD